MLRSISVAALLWVATAGSAASQGAVQETMMLAAARAVLPTSQRLSEVTWFVTPETEASVRAIAARLGAPTAVQHEVISCPGERASDCRMSVPLAVRVDLPAIKGDEATLFVSTFYSNSGSPIPVGGGKFVVHLRRTEMGWEVVEVEPKFYI